MSEMKGGLTNHFTLCKVCIFGLSTLLVRHTIRHSVSVSVSQVEVYPTVKLLGLGESCWVHQLEQCRMYVMYV